MKTVLNIEEQMQQYFKVLNESQKKVLLMVAKTFVEDANPMIDKYDEDFVKELDSRTKELENGEIEGYSWEEVKQRPYNGKIK